MNSQNPSNSCSIYRVYVLCNCISPKYLLIALILDELHYLLGLIWDHGHDPPSIGVTQHWDWHSWSSPRCSYPSLLASFHKLHIFVVLMLIAAPLRAGHPLHKFFLPCTQIMIQWRQILIKVRYDCRLLALLLFSVVLIAHSGRILLFLDYHRTASRSFFIFLELALTLAALGLNFDPIRITF